MPRNHSILILPVAVLAGIAYAFAPEGDVRYGPADFTYPVPAYIEKSMPGQRDDTKVVSHSEIEYGLCSDEGAYVFVTHEMYDADARRDRTISYRVPCDHFIDAWVGNKLTDEQSWGRSPADPPARRITAIVQRNPDVSMQFGDTSLMESRSSRIKYIKRNVERPDCEKLTATLLKCPLEHVLWRHRVQRGSFLFVDDVTKVSEVEHFLYFICKLDWGTYSCASRSWLEHGVEVNLQFRFAKEVTGDPEKLRLLLNDIEGWIVAAEGAVKDWQQ